MSQKPQSKSLSIKATDETLAGKYANMVQVSHNREEVVFDFVNAFPPAAQLNARVVMTPGHAKRFLNALGENVRRYEERFGPIQIAEKKDNINGWPVA